MIAGRRLWAAASALLSQHAKVGDSTMGTAVWGGLFYAGGMALSFALVRRLFPRRVAEDGGPPLTELERRIYWRWEAASILPIILFATLLTYACYLALRGASHLFVKSTPGTRYLVETIPIFWLLPAFFLGVLWSAVPMVWIYRRLLGDRFPRYERACNERAGFDGRRALVWLGALITAAAAASFVAGVTSFARFHEDGVEISRPLALRSKYYPYSRVQAIEHRATIRPPNALIIKRPHHVILFDDGTSWSTRDGLRDPVPDVDARIAELVSQRSGQPIVEVP